MEDACALRAHQRLRYGRRRAVFDKILERLDALPVAVIAEETARGFLRRLVPERRTWMRRVVLHAFAQGLHPVLEHAAQYDCTVTFKRFPFCSKHGVLLLSIDWAFL
jgi:hypothetical protein